VPVERDQALARLSNPHPSTAVLVTCENQMVGSANDSLQVVAVLDATVLDRVASDEDVEVVDELLPVWGDA